MNKNPKFKKMKIRGIGYSIGGMLLDYVSGTKPVNNNRMLQNACIVGGCISSVLSVANYIRSLEKYDDYEEGDEIIVLSDYVSDFILPTALSIYSIHNSAKLLKDRKTRL